MKNLKKSILLAALASAAAVSSPAFAQTGPHHPLTCCDPKLVNPKIGTMFSDDIVGNLSAPFGVKFNPTPAFKTAFQNTATIASIMTGQSGFLVLRGHMKSDFIPNQAWANPTTGASIFWNSNPPMVGSGQEFIYAEDTPAAPFNWTFSPYVATAMAGMLPAPPHFKANGTRYAVKMTYWLYYKPPHKPWEKVEIICSGLNQQFLGINKSPQAAGMVVGGGGNQLGGGGNQRSALIVSEGSPVSRDQIRVGPPITLTDAEVAALPAELKASVR